MGDSALFCCRMELLGVCVLLLAQLKASTQRATSMLSRSRTLHFSSTLSTYSRNYKHTRHVSTTSCYTCIDFDVVLPSR